MADHPDKSKIREQVEMGVAVRMAAFELMNQARETPETMVRVP